MSALVDRWWPSVVSTALFGGLWFAFGLSGAICFSVGFVSAAVLIAFEIGVRKHRARGADQ